MRHTITYRKQQSGFTLIELVIVIAIIGILAVVAVPKFINISTDAQAAATNGVAGAIGSAAATNYAVRMEKAGNGSAVANCTDTAALLQGNALPTNYTITAAAIPAGTTVTCTLKGPNGSTATFSATGIA